MKHDKGIAQYHSLGMPIRWMLYRSEYICELVFWSCLEYSFWMKSNYVIWYVGEFKFAINPLKTSPEYTRAGVYGKCVL